MLETLPRRRQLALGSLGITVLTLLLRGAQLGRPRTFVFDEVYYANEALDLIVQGAERPFVVHPPLGKWLISFGFLTGSFSPLTWRLTALLAGAVVVVLVFLCAERLTKSMPLALAAAAFVLTDGIAHVTGRYALLDGFAAVFTTAVLYVLVRTKDERLHFPAVAVIGLLCGAALATKWTTAPVVLIAVVVCMIRIRRDSPLRGGFAAAGLMGILMLVVYLGSYMPWIVSGAENGNCTKDVCDESAVERVAQLPSMQWKMIDYNLDLKRRTPSMARGWHWAIQDESGQLFTQHCNGADDAICNPDDRGRTMIEGRGNIVLWLGSLLVFAYWVARRWRARAPSSGVGLVMVWAAALWLPWLFRAAFTFYAAPIVPALAIGIVAALNDAVPERPRVASLTLMVTASVMIFALTRHAVPWAA